MLLAAMLLPALRRANETSKLVGCTSNLRQLYLASVSYGNDNKDFPPPTNDDSATWSLVGGYPTAWPYLLMPYLGYNGPASQYVTANKNHGSLEIRLYGPAANQCYKAPDGDTTTRKSGVFWCPATRGLWNNWYTAAGPYGCWGDVAIDYAINSYVTGWVTSSGTWMSVFSDHVKFGDTSRTTPSKLLYIGDAYGFFYRLYLTPSNRHYARGELDNESGRMNCVMFDGHVENFNYDGWPYPQVRVNSSAPERLQPGWKYYVHP